MDRNIQKLGWYRGTQLDRNFVPHSFLGEKTRKLWGTFCVEGISQTKMLAFLLDATHEREKFVRASFSSFEWKH